jgi:hypothetical protein
MNKQCTFVRLAFTARALYLHVAETTQLLFKLFLANPEQRHENLYKLFNIFKVKRKLSFYL